MKPGPLAPPSATSSNDMASCPPEEVYNTAGQLINSLVDKDLFAGAYKTTWDAMTQDGQQASSGVYFYRMEAGDFTDTRSMTLLK